MKIPEGFKLPKANNTKPHNMCSIKLQRSLYGLKQFERMWYNLLSEYLLKEGYANNPICPCIFIKKSKTGFAIIVVYVDDLNLIETPEELRRKTKYLKMEFEMKDLRKKKFCLGLQIEHFPTGVLVHQSTYTKKILNRFYMDKPEAMIVAPPSLDRASVFSMCFPEEIPNYDLPMDLGDGLDGVIFPNTYIDAMDMINIGRILDVTSHGPHYAFDMFGVSMIDSDAVILYDTCTNAMDMIGTGRILDAAPPGPHSVVYMFGTSML